LGYANESAASSKNVTLESSKGYSDKGPKVTDFDNSYGQYSKSSRPAAKEAFTQKLTIKGRPKYPLKGADCQNDASFDDLLT